MDMMYETISVYTDVVAQTEIYDIISEVISNPDHMDETGRFGMYRYIPVHTGTYQYVPRLGLSWSCRHAVVKRKKKRGRSARRRCCRAVDLIRGRGRPDQSQVAAPCGEQP